MEDKPFDFLGEVDSIVNELMQAKAEDLPLFAHMMTNRPDSPEGEAWNAARLQELMDYCRVLADSTAAGLDQARNSVRYKWGNPEGEAARDRLFAAANERIRVLLFERMLYIFPALISLIHNEMKMVIRIWDCLGDEGHREHMDTQLTMIEKVEQATQERLTEYRQQHGIK